MSYMYQVKKSLPKWRVWLHEYSTGASLRELTDAEHDLYLDLIANDHTHTGAIDGAPFGNPGVTVYAG